MKKHRLKTAILVYILGFILLAYFSGRNLLSHNFNLRFIDTTFIFFIGWTIFGGYYLIYDNISDSAEKWIEGTISGLSVSIFLYFADQFLVIRKYQERSDFWGNHTWTIETKRASLPNEAAFLIILFFIIWLAIDIWKLKFDNAIVKFVLFIISIISYLVIPANSELKIIFTTIISIALAFGYYYFSQIKSARKQISILLYVSLSLGVIATIMKHWDFFSRKLLIQDYTFSGLAEVFSDFVVFLLGFLLTIFESSKTESRQSQHNIPVQKIVQEVGIEKKDIPNKPTYSLRPAVALLALVGIAAMIKSICTTSKLNEKGKSLVKSKMG
ncbi:MAG: hypothetical protein L6461_07390 [Anaerolineae bacterium]|nr:hypothetical protein [Anaerolineae bacterium]